jgi:hypothetical protein
MTVADPWGVSPHSLPNCHPGSRPIILELPNAAVSDSRENGRICPRFVRVFDPDTPHSIPKFSVKDFLELL